MEIKSNISLKPYNTFGIEAVTNQFVEVENTNDLVDILRNNSAPILILGGGSNVLFTTNFNGLVIKNNLKGIELVNESREEVFLKVGAGEVWHDFVIYCIQNDYAGAENMSLIPGSVGASPMQNIGAYGAEVKNIIVEVEALHLKSYQIEKFTNKACQFGYRTSIFKTSEKGNYFITSVTYKLSKKALINTSYGAIEDQLEKMNITSPSIKDVSDAVITIRNTKLPNPKEIGNAGSFFKNPVISSERKDHLLSKFPKMPHYTQENGTWLVNRAKWLEREKK